MGSGNGAKVDLSKLANEILPKDGDGINIKIMKYGIWAICIVAAIMFLVIICIVIYLLVFMPSIKLASLTEDQLKIYKEVRVIVMDEAMKIGDQFLLKLWLPILTLLLGYIFGREKK